MKKARVFVSSCNIKLVLVLQYLFLLPFLENYFLVFKEQTLSGQQMSVAIYLIVVFFSVSLYAVIVEQNLFKKILFVSFMQSSVIIYYIINVWNLSASTPFYTGTNVSNYVDPVPQVLMLTAIVVGFATTALCLAMVMCIKKKTGTVMYNEINEKNFNSSLDNDEDII